ncbi:hypothetical protein GGQ68_000524 [Sagittula marina]|uniref:Uncharacterized protein n=1 Tax=Sagittula marina TaxID=943940 RepID=A0A7W6GR50_9RHOB|nr:hypothetical protein [Sagittula marina]
MKAAGLSTLLKVGTELAVRGPADPRRGAGYRHSGRSADCKLPVAGRANTDHPARLLSAGNRELLRVIHEEKPASRWNNWANSSAVPRQTFRARSRSWRVSAAFACEWGKDSTGFPRSFVTGLTWSCADQASQERNPQMKVRNPDVAVRAALYLRVFSLHQPAGRTCRVDPQTSASRAMHGAKRGAISLRDLHGGWRVGHR